MYLLLVKKKKKKIYIYIFSWVMWIHLGGETYIWLNPSKWIPFKIIMLLSLETTQTFLIFIAMFPSERHLYFWIYVYLMSHNKFSLPSINSPTYCTETISLLYSVLPHRSISMWKPHQLFYSPLHMLRKVSIFLVVRMSVLIVKCSDFSLLFHFRTLHQNTLNISLFILIKAM